MTYLSGRNNPLSGEAPDIEVEAALGAVENAFTKRWLDEPDDHPVRRVWRRSDGLATVELFTLGNAIQRLNTIDPGWVRRTLKRAKEGDPSNQLGFLFEIIGGASVAARNTVKLAADNQPGYDIITQQAALTIRWSLKRYGDSKASLEFIRQARETESLLAADLGKLAPPRAPMVFVQYYQHPNPGDWTLLRSSVAAALSSFTGQPLLLQVSSRCAVTLTSLSGSLSKEHASYTLIAIAPYSENEIENLWSKLEEAYRGFNLNNLTESSDVNNCVLVRLPDTVAATDCAEWAHQYLVDYPNARISRVVLMQPTIARDPATGSSSVHFLVCGRNRAAVSLPPSQFLVPVGTIDNAPTTSQLVVGDNAITVKEHYVFQSGRHFMTPDASGGCEIGSPAPGIIQYAVVATGLSDHHIITPKLPEEERLVLI